MRRQTREDDCGPTALANAFEVHHQRIGLRTLRTLVGTTDDGSDEHDLVRALLAYGCGVDEFARDDPREAHLWLLESIAYGRPAILCLDRWGHWVTAIGSVAGQIVIYDPARETGGTFVLRFKDLKRRWEATKRVRRGAPRFYGISVGPPTCTPV